MTLSQYKKAVELHKKMVRDFKKEQKRWEALRVGDIVFEHGSWDDLFKMVIEEINVNERYAICTDHSQDKIKVKVSGFSTIGELKEAGERIDWIRILHDDNDIMLPNMFYVKKKYKDKFLKTVNADTDYSAIGAWDNYPKYLNGINGRRCDYSKELLFEDDVVYCVLVMDC